MNHQTTQLREKTGLRDLETLIDCVRGCGVDAKEYLNRRQDLQKAGHDTRSALIHFLTCGYAYAEGRNPPCGDLPDGLEQIRSLEIPNREYARQLFRCIFFSQLKNRGTPERLWAGIGRGVHDSIRAMGGVPYYIAGDSHVNHYVRAAWVGARWLAPLPLVCVGACAVDLANDKSRWGARLLQWAEATTSLHPDFDVPIFLKFGGIDAEYRWMWRRIHGAQDQASAEEFEQFARQSVTAYAGFVDALGRIVDPTLLRVCSVFPAVIADRNFIEDFVYIHQSSPEADRDLTERLHRTEIPDLVERTKLRARYNTHLREMCRQRGLRFVDDFSPLLNSDGTLDRRFVPAGRDIHVDHAASEAPLVKILQGMLPVGAGGCRRACR